LYGSIAVTVNASFFYDDLAIHFYFAAAFAGAGLLGGFGFCVAS
jgi:hypothetical protein